MKATTMRKYINNMTGAEVYVGSTQDVKAMYKSIARASKNGNTDIFPWFSSPARFNPIRSIYGVEIESEHNYGGYAMTVINSDTLLSMIMSGELEEA